MCAIFAATTIERFKEIYFLNKERGHFAYGTAHYNEAYNDFLITKKEGIIDFDNWQSGEEDTYFVGHTQAPTSSIRSFSRDTSHPFCCGNVLVAHNGVLTNEKELKDKCKSHFNEVDSSVIPALICDRVKAGEDYEYAILNTLSELKGTYSFWIIGGYDLYFGRAGSTLFMNKEKREFSSIKMPGIEEEVPEGILYKAYSKGKFIPSFEEVGFFKVNTPFFII